jgi:predicted ATP-dependent endonuclease of OLD family
MTNSFLKSLEIESFRGFFDKQVIGFAIPDNERNGSGLTIIVGPNNTGKTSIMEALLVKENGKFKDYERHTEKYSKITISSNSGKTITYEGTNGSEIIKTGEIDCYVELVSSKRQWSSNFTNNKTNAPTFSQNSNQLKVRGPSGADVIAALVGINKNEATKNELTNFMKEMVPDFTDWTIDTNDQGDYVKYGVGKYLHQASFLGDGILSLFRIFIHFVDKNHPQKILIIDEPELSLHPTAQKALAKHLSDFSKNNQVIICTHSPHFINWEDIENGAGIIRLNKKEEKCLVSRLTPFRKEISGKISKLTADWMKPQLMDIVAKEIFFSDRILFVEGQEDVALIKKWFKDHDEKMNFDIFGYGVGGRGNFNVFLEIAKTLGLRKVAALYDGDEDALKNFKADKDNFKADGFGFFQLPTGDIRDKEKKDCTDCKKTYQNAKNGIFDRNGKLKPETEKCFKAVMEEIIEFFKS